MNAGRWNRKGTAAIYSASSQALGALEILANCLELPLDYVAVSINIPDDLAVTTLTPASLPEHWWTNPHPPETREMGSCWALTRSSAVLSVPSAVVRQDRNYILNPEHPDFARISFGPPEPFLWDARFRSLLPGVASPA